MPVEIAGGHCPELGLSDLPHMQPVMSRRQLLGLGAAAGGGMFLGAAGHGVLEGESATKRPDSAAVPFRGEHQAGIETPRQAYMTFAAFDFAGRGVDDLRAVLQGWTLAGAQMTAGHRLGEDPGSGRESLLDSGEAADLGASNLTLSFGLGPDLFAKGRMEGMDLPARRPDALVDVPAFPGDQLDPSRSGGDLCVHACADDPQVAFHAVRDLASLGRGTTIIKWIQQAFRGGGPGSPARGRNLLGFRDGSNNLAVSDPMAMTQSVWVGASDQPDWMRGGTYMVVRRIRMRIGHWDSVSLEEQEQTFGRRKASGAPLGGEVESDAVDPAKLPPDCHVIQANPRTGGSEAERILRRSYSFSDGIDARFGELDAGLFFICFQRDPRKQFIPIQTRLAEHDHLTEYTFHTGSAIFAVPPGVSEGEYIGQTLLEAI